MAQHGPKAAGRRAKPAPPAGWLFGDDSAPFERSADVAGIKCAEHPFGSPPLGLALHGLIS